MSERQPARLRSWRIATAVGCAILVTTISIVWIEDPGILAGLGLGGPGGASHNGTIEESYDLQSYSSSIDGTPLSYYEWLPLGYTPSQSYPFLLYLHGKGYQGGQVFGIAGGISAVNAGISQGFIVGALETRSEGGFYVDSKYTGPQEQDVLDAITHEKMIRSVSGVWLFGFSMGTMGAFSIAEHHPGLVRGIGVIAPCPDLYEVEAYKVSVNLTDDFNFWLQVTGGSLANQSAYADGLTYYLSAFRYSPQNLSGVRLYVSAGGNDRDCPNNPKIFGFQQANDTLTESTCTTAASLDEPANCTAPYGRLALQNPSGYPCRYVYDPTGPHSLDLLNGNDMVAFFLGAAPTGSYEATLGGVPFLATG
jgi:pimeloyl-ACP methyl ester carboxylesterase